MHIYIVVLNYCLPFLGDYIENLDILFFGDWGTRSDREKNVRAEKQTNYKQQTRPMRGVAFEI